MKNVFFFLFIFVLMNDAFAQTPTTNPELFTRQSGLDDEFNSSSLSGMWNDYPAWLGPVTVEYSPGGANVTTYATWNGDGSGFTNHNISFSGSTMSLQARVESTPLYVLLDNYSGTYGTFSNTGKAISTKNYYYYGFFEFYARMPSTLSQAGQQIWLYHQFCSYDSSYGFPHPSWVNNRYSELDVFEINDNTSPLVTVPIATHSWDCGGTQYEYNNPSASSSYTSSTSLTGWHKYGINWQPGYVDFYFDDALVSHQTYLIRTSDGNTVPISRLQAMPIILQTKFTQPAASSLPPTSVSQNFDLDYFHYYKMDPVVAAPVFGSGTVTLTASEGIDNESYSWTRTSGSGTVGTPTTTTTGSTATITMGSGTSTFAITAATGSSLVYPISGSSPASYINPSTSATTKVIVSGANCWDMGQADLVSDVDLYYAKCINAPGGTYTSFIISGNRNIKFAANTGIQLNAGFEVTGGSSFEAKNY